MSKFVSCAPAARSRLIAGGCAAMLCLALSSLSAAGQIDKAEQNARAYDMALGSPKALVTVVEYASAGCPACARWDKDVFPTFKAKYIDTGKVRFVFREILVGGPDEVHVGESSFLLARCAGADQYFPVIHAVFRVLPGAYKMWDDTQVQVVLLKIARTMGMTEREFDHCVADQATLQALRARVAAFERNDQIDAAPSFVVNDVPLSLGFQSLSQLDGAIGHALGGPAPPLPAVQRSTGKHSILIRAVDDSGPADVGARPPRRGDVRAHQGYGGDLWLRPGAVISTAMFKEARVGTSDMDDQPMVVFRLNGEGRRRLSAFTAANVGQRIAIVVDGAVVSSPRIMAPITDGGGQITGVFNAEEAADIARSINGSQPQGSADIH